MAECKHTYDDGEKDTSPYSHGFCIVNYIYTCTKCGETMNIEKDVS